MFGIASNHELVCSTAVRFSTLMMSFLAKSLGAKFEGCRKIKRLLYSGYEQVNLIVTDLLRIPAAYHTTVRRTWVWTSS